MSEPIDTVTIGKTGAARSIDRVHARYFEDSGYVCVKIQQAGGRVIALRLGRESARRLAESIIRETS